MSQTPPKKTATSKKKTYKPEMKEGEIVREY